MFQKGASKADVQGRPERVQIRGEMRQRDAEEYMLIHSVPRGEALVTRQPLLSGEEAEQTATAAGECRGGAEGTLHPSAVS